MVDIQSKEAIDKISDELKVQPALAIGRKLNDSIQPVFEVGNNANVMIKIANDADAAGAGNIFVASATKRTFIIGCGLSISKDAVSDSINTLIRVFPSTTLLQTTILQLNYEPTTAGHFDRYIFFPIPIEIQKGSTIQTANSAGTASIDRTAIVYYYETDPQ